MAEPTTNFTNTTAVPEGFEHVQNPENGHGNGPRIISITKELEMICGPLINFLGITYDKAQALWHGSVLIVTKPGQKKPKLQLKSLGPVGTTEDGQPKKGWFSRDRTQVVDGLLLYTDSMKAFWRFTLELPLESAESRWEYTIPDMTFLSNIADSGPSRTFVVPGNEDSMRLMFHSCNGFSVGTDEEAWSGPALWNSVVRIHEKRPFHAMVGGGDQIYNDSVRVSGPLKEWTSISNPQKRRKYPFGQELRDACDEFYFKNYTRWYSTEPFASANAQIPQVNIWDDHDIIDGFGSYTDHFMQCPVFRGIGSVAFKYYCLFQHHVAPPKSTFTTDAPQTMEADGSGTTAADPQQLADSYVYGTTADSHCWIVGPRPGPYVEECSRNLYMRFGKRMALLGIDARTERTRHQVNYPETYEKIFSRLDSELTAANGEIKHLILLLGIPIAYPRLAWLENVLSSPLIAPIRLLNKRFGFAGGFFNHFDGSVDLLDDLDDHYTARTHKQERAELVHRLQAISKKHSVRITILGGDVHLSALGRFYSNPKLHIPSENDYRYMANIVSSAITNKPPPQAIANLLARRNKIHHLDDNTDETLMSLFDAQPGGQKKAADFNKVTMPSRNFAVITEVTAGANTGSSSLLGANLTNGNAPASVNGDAASVARTARTAKSGHEPLHAGEDGAGVNHSAADGVTATSGMIGGLDVAIMVEIDQHDPEGKTQGYGFSIPTLSVSNVPGSKPSSAG